jgi:regulator of replication initiation timing
MRTTKLASVLSECLELPNGQMIELDNPKFLEWLETPENRSFRFQYGFAGEQSFTARKETNKRGQANYWYGYRKVESKLHKRYIGKSEDVTRLRLQEVAVALDTPSPERTKRLSYINNCVTNEPKPDELQTSYLSSYVTQEQLEDCQQHCEALVKENQHLASKLIEIEQLQQQLGALASENAELRARCQQRPEIPDLEAIRDRFLASLRLGKQASEYKRTKSALDRFIAFVTKG